MYTHGHAPFQLKRWVETIGLGEQGGDLARAGRPGKPGKISNVSSRSEEVHAQVEGIGAKL